jgi:hypothetical protein
VFGERLSVSILLYKFSPHKFYPPLFYSHAVFSVFSIATSKIKLSFILTEKVFGVSCAQRNSFDERGIIVNSIKSLMFSENINSDFRNVIGINASSVVFSYYNFIGKYGLFSDVKNAFGLCLQK